MRLSASKLDLAMRCSASLHGEHDASSSREASIGSAFHWAVSELRKRPHPDWRGYTSDAITGALALSPQLYVEEYPGRAEVAYDLDIATGACREISLSAPRDYPWIAEHIYGTADLVEINGDTAVVTDWKTGSQAECDADTWQLRCLAAMAAVAAGVPRAMARCVLVRDCPVTESIDVDVAATISAIRDWYADMMALPAAPEPGHHCRSMYCPRLASCPATQLAVSALAGLPAAHSMAVRSAADITGPEHASWLLGRLQVVEGACEAIRAALKEHAAQTPIRVDESHVWRKTTSTRTTYRGTVADFAMVPDTEVTAKIYKDQADALKHLAHETQVESYRVVKG